jgi:polar amino acid transport system substrate-binding protein
MKQALAGAILVGLMTLAIQPATAQTPDELKAKGTITVGMLVDFPPFGITDLQGQPDGYDADVAKLLAERLGVNIEIVPVTGPNRIPYLQTGRVDLLVASLAITPERAQQVQFSDPYAAVNVVLYARKDLPITEAANLSGITIAVARASTQDIALTRQAPADAQIQRFDDDATATQALLSGQVQALGAGTLVVNEINKIAPADTFETKFSLFTQVHGIVMRPDQPELLAWINQFVADTKADGSLNAISQKWLGADLPEMQAPDYVKR